MIAAVLSWDGISLEFLPAAPGGGGGTSGCSNQQIRAEKWKFNLYLFVYEAAVGSQKKEGGGIIQLNLKIKLIPINFGRRVLGVACRKQNVNPEKSCPNLGSRIVTISLLHLLVVFHRFCLIPFGKFGKSPGFHVVSYKHFCSHPSANQHSV